VRRALRGDRLDPVEERLYFSDGPGSLLRVDRTGAIG
jgi:hypothetical protein